MPPLSPTPLTTLNDIFTQLASLNTSPSTLKLPDSARPYLLTLHVLFPHLLLPALDLLDRSLVTRHVLEAPSLSADAAPQVHTGAADEHSDHTGQGARSIVGYDVTSASSVYGNNRFASRSSEVRYGDGEDASGNVVAGRTYQVSVDGWHCSCPAFAFAAFGGRDVSGVGADGDATVGEGRFRPLVDRFEREEEDRVYGTRQRNEKLGLGYGGLICTTRSRSEEKTLPPICKHLLAVVLGEWCGGVFQYQSKAGRGMREKIMTPDVIAGWAAGSGL